MTKQPTEIMPHNDINNHHDKDRIDFVKRNSDEGVGQVSGIDLEKEKTAQGDAYFHRLGWKRLTIILIVESVALAASVCLQLLPHSGCYIIGQVKLKYPDIHSYADIGGLLMGKFGDWLFSFAFVSLLLLVIGSHCLTGTIALGTITESNVCSLVFGVVSAIILLILAIPPSFAEIAILGYVDFASILLAIGITLSAWPKENLTLAEAFVAISNIVFSYSFAGAQPSFMDEMHTPQDYTKSIYALGVIQTTIYALTGSLIYLFVGRDVGSPALVSAGPLVAKIAFGVALPVIYISGSINTTITCRFIHVRMYHDSIVRFVNTRKGWITWLLLVTIVTFFSWIIAEAIPFFSELLSLAGCLFVAGLSFYIPPIMWLRLLKQGNWYDGANLIPAIANLVVFIAGFTVFGIGFYASVTQIVHKFESGSINRPFSCSAL
ncbi:hypothetical protein CDV31_009027 [Fusarium ambrosium]|uniref:Amino acid transporter transmembrane domain-containing protein n=1 Tax=Fusarium ambrosium TaxID=131363 RepID=A0A428TX60_9HYPO|nr:hypothetical protein CDV31_009027 [Fusarium ambrosium]